MDGRKKKLFNYTYYVANKLNTLDKSFNQALDYINGYLSPSIT